MTLEQLVVKNRSYRRFEQSRRVSRRTLEELADLARRTASGANRQPLKYLLLHTPEDCARLFPFLAWAARLRPWPGPAEGERPAAYFVILCDKEVSANAGCDHGIAAQTILLGAVERGLGGCMLGAIDRARIAAEFRIPARYEVLLVVALGAPAEQCVLEEAPPGGEVGYYRDAAGVHHVPKRTLSEILVSF
jgi:nitroreductase